MMKLTLGHSSDIARNVRVEPGSSKENVDFRWTPRGKHVSIPAMKFTRASLLTVILTALICPAALAAESQTMLALWPHEVPGETNAIGEEKDMTKPNEGLVAGKRVIRLGNVSKPTITVYPA